MALPQTRALVRRSFWWDVVLYAGLWTLLGLFSGTQQIVSSAFMGHAADWHVTLGTELLNWYTCGLATPLYVWLVRRFPLDGPALAPRIALYLTTILVCVPLKFAVWVPLQDALFHTRWRFTDLLVTEAFGVVTAQVFFVVLVCAVEYYRTARERELHTSQLETELSQARLESLRSQLHPHFLFNTLNSISALMQRDVAAADEMLSRLGDMLRASLRADEAQETPLRDELDTVKLYLDIMRVRFRDRLATQIDVPDALLAEHVPSFLLQPLVENAVRHGIDESSTMTHIRVTAGADDALLRLRVIDDGRGLPPNATLREGFGLRNTRRRLEQLYGSAGTLTIVPREAGGTEVIITVPRRERTARATATLPPDRVLRPSTA
jgi:two-component system, LytTR family, sensor kinase